MIMDALITGEGDGIVGLSVIDNNDVEHLIEMNFEGTITGHQQDGYPDDSSKRTVQEHEHVNQTRRFARFYVYRKRGYDTIEPLRNPDRIATAALAVANLSPEQCREYFGDSYRQLRSHDAGTEPIVDVPDEATDEVLRVGQDIYLDLAEDAFVSIVETLSEADAFEHLETAAGEAAADENLLTAFQRVLRERNVDLDEEGARIGATLIDAVGPVSVRWTKNGTDYVEQASTAASLPDRDPAARPQMPPSIYEFDSIESFQRSLVYHLLCQVRDCYIEMGIAPPEGVRIQGPGFYENIGWYKHHDVYSNYYDTTATITDWQEDHTPDDLLV